ncbi:MAG TPA: helix-turn-helix domain-containing protein [Baekduia sp.]
MAAISDRALRLAGGLMDPLRLRVLLALEVRASTATQLSKALDVPYDRVNWAVKQLVKVDLVELRAIEPAASGMVMQKVYVARHRGWAALVPVLDAIAASAAPER